MAENYEVKQGDTLISIAHQKGYRNWKTIWNHESNAGLRELREKPHILLPGDKVFIPDKQPKEDNCETNKRHTFIVPTLTAHVRVVLEDEEGQPYAGKDYKLTVDGKDYHGKTQSDGLVEEEVPAHAKEARLTLWPDDKDMSQVMTWTLQIGHLDPIDEISGIQARLNNLGYDCGEVTGELNDQTKQALMSFQEDNSLEPTGKVDDATRSKLEKSHD